MTRHLTAGEVLDGTFRLIRALGSGAYGEVWSAERVSSGALVAIKFLRIDDEKARLRFRRESRVLKRLDHPNCLRLEGIGSDATYLVTPLVSGVTLYEWQQGDWSREERLAVMLQIAEALKHAHRNGVIHRDLKPANVMVDAEQHVTVLDFGISKLVGIQHGNVTKTGEVLGTPGYMSPEQLSGEAAGPATDLYALGVMLYEIFARRRLFGGATAFAVAMCHLRDTPPEPVEAPPHLQKTIRRLLAKAPGKRGTAAAVVREMRPPPHAVPSGEQASARGFRRIAAGGALLGCVVGAVLIGSSSSDNPLPKLPATRPVPSFGVEKPEPESEPDAGRPRSKTPRKAECLGLQDGLNELNVRGIGPVHVWTAKTGSQVGRSPILVLHGGGHDGEVVLRNPRLVEQARKRNVVLIAPTAEHGTIGAFLSSTWGRRDERLAAWRAAQAVIADSCLDHGLLVYGQAAGGRGAERLLCEVDGIKALVAAASRPYSAAEVCDDKVDAAVLLLSPETYPGSPVEGGAACGDDIARSVLSLDQHEEIARNRAGCTGDAEVLGRRDARCFTWSCDAQLTSCRVKGGYPWRTTSDENRCWGPSPRFDYEEAAFNFLDRHISPPQPP